MTKPGWYRSGMAYYDEDNGQVLVIKHAGGDDYVVRPGHADRFRFVALKTTGLRAAKNRAEDYLVRHYRRIEPPYG